MKNKIAVITGAGKGLGQETAVQFAQDNIDVVLVARSKCTETEEKIKATRTNARFISVQCDISDPAQVAEMKKKVDEFGGCDILVNNAGIYPFIMFEDLSYEQWKAYFATNVDGPFNCCKAFLPGMQEKGWGRVVNIASNAFMNGADPMLSGYVSTKGAVIGLARALASEYGPHGITVNCVAPGLFVCDTTVGNIGGKPGDEGAKKWDLMYGLQAIKKNPYPSDFVGAIKFLVSDAASFMTAQTLVVDGGLARV